MIESKVIISNDLGLHARAAAKLVAMASGFKSEITLGKDGKSVNGKSILGVMMLAASKGTELQLCVEGADEQEATDQLLGLINNRFGEDT
jgi:phosphocarrier protein HPr